MTNDQRVKLVDLLQGHPCIISQPREPHTDIIASGFNIRIAYSNKYGRGSGEILRVERVDDMTGEAFPETRSKIDSYLVKLARKHLEELTDTVDELDSLLLEITQGEGL